MKQKAQLLRIQRRFWLSSSCSGDTALNQLVCRFRRKNSCNEYQDVGVCFDGTRYRCPWWKELIVTRLKRILRHGVNSKNLRLSQCVVKEQNFEISLKELA